MLPKANFSLGLTMKVKGLFFDRQRVMNAFGAKGRRTMMALSKIGAYVRRRAQTSMRWKTWKKEQPGQKKKRGRKNKNQPSPRGKPPFAWRHGGQLRTLLFFGYDEANDSVVVGPIKFKKGEAPALHEFGGTAKREKRGGGSYTAVYAQRAFMGPALQYVQPRIPEAFKSVVKAA